MISSVVLLCVASTATAADTPAENRYATMVLDGEMDLESAALLAVQHGGRKKPLHTLAVEHLEQITGRPFFLATPYYKEPAKQRRLSAMDVYLSMYLDTRDWFKEPVILVAHGLLRRELGLPEDQKRFTYHELADSEHYESARKLGALVQSAQALRQAKREKEQSDLEKEAEVVFDRLRLLGDICSGATVNCIPHPTDPNGTWISPGVLGALMQDPEKSVGLVARTYTRGDHEKAQKLAAAYLEAYKPAQVEDLRVRMSAFAQAYQQRERAAFANAALDLRQTLRQLSPDIYPNLNNLEREVSYNNLRPFGKAWLFYLAALVFGALSFRTQNKAVYGALLAIFLGGLALHVYGFTLRCLIAGRPPVSNMFESVIWVGFGTVLFGLIFELIYRPKYFLLCGAAGGFLCLVLMDLMPVVMGNSMLPGFEAHINPLVPVLRDNFWLTVHVLTITLSYSAFALAWVLGHVTLWKHLIRPQDKHEHHVLHQFIYRVIQAGVLLLAIGTILGAVWAYYSWGRFWGWDPKETWAFITLLCYLVILHGRYTSLWGNFGLCVGAVICFQSVVMAWYGVNFVLGNGLHAYASGAGGEEYVFTIVAVDAIFTGLTVYRHLDFKRTATVAATANAEASLPPGNETTTQPATGSGN